MSNTYYLALFSKLFKAYIGKDAVYNFINNMIEESKYCEHLEKHHYKDLLVSK